MNRVELIKFTEWLDENVPAENIFMSGYEDGTQKCIAAWMSRYIPAVYPIEGHSVHTLFDLSSQQSWDLFIGRSRTHDLIRREFDALEPTVRKAIVLTVLKGLTVTGTVDWMRACRASIGEDYGRLFAARAHLAGGVPPVSEQH